LSWRGFKLKNGNNENYISIDTENDFVIGANGYQVIKIGRINDDNLTYGIRIRNKEQDEVFSATASGLNIGGWSVTPSSL
jgi:hypothetical protein